MNEILLLAIGAVFGGIGFALYRAYGSGFMSGTDWKDLTIEGLDADVKRMREIILSQKDKIAVPRYPTDVQLAAFIDRMEAEDWTGLSTDNAKTLWRAVVEASLATEKKDGHVVPTA